MIDLDEIEDKLEKLVDKAKPRKDKKMPVASSIGSGAAFGLANALTGDLGEYVGNAISGLVKNEAVREAVGKVAQGAVKQQFPGLFGFGVKEEAEFNTARDLLSPDDQHRVMQVVKYLRDHYGDNYVQRWQLIVATKKIEGMMWDPSGPMIVPSQEAQKTTNGAWGLPKKTQAKTKGPVPIEGTPADPRVITLRNVARKVEAPPAVTGIQGDTPEAVQYAAEDLMDTVLHDHHFYKWFIRWWKRTVRWWQNADSDSTRAALKASQEAVKRQLGSLWTSLIAMEIGEERLEGILSQGESPERVLAAVEKSLQDAIKTKRKKLRENAFWHGPVRLLLVGLTVFIIGIILIGGVQLLKG